jgi:hypothetical protein
MKRIKTGFVMALCLSPLMLAACGEGWVAVYSDDIFPYGNERTAGSGVVYLRESMLPAKDIQVEVPAQIIEPAAPAVEEVPAEPEADPMHDAFMGSQSK